jgi:hypothetical protein
MLILKEEASIKEFCLIRSLFGRNNYFDEKLNLDVLFDYLMEFEIRCIDVNGAISCEINIRVLSPRVICDNGGIESLGEWYR